MRAKAKVLANLPQAERIESFVYPAAPGTDFRQVVGGLNFPSGASPGFAVIVAEDRRQGPEIRLYHEWVLAELEEEDCIKLFAHCLEYESAYKVGFWYGDYSDLRNLRLLEEFNRVQRLACRQPLYVLPPSFLGERDFSSCLDLILGRLVREEGVLHFAPNSKLRERVRQLLQRGAAGNIAHKSGLMEAFACALAPILLRGAGSLFGDRVKQKKDPYSGTENQPCCLLRQQGHACRCCIYGDREAAFNLDCLGSIGLRWCVSLNDQAVVG